MDPFRPAPRFDGTGFQRWKILMQAHLQATGLNVWRVVSEGVKNRVKLDSCHYNFLKLDFMLKSMPLSGMILNMKPNFTELWWHESNFPLWKTISGGSAMVKPIVREKR